MKKSLLIILSLIFMNMTAHAVGVDCWEEVDGTFNPNTVSKMQAVLGNNVTITRVKTEVSVSLPTTESIAYEGTGRMYTNTTGFTTTRIPITSYLYHNYNGTVPYYIESNRTESTSKNGYASDGGFMVHSNGMSTSYSGAMIGRKLTGETGGSYYNTSSDYNFAPSLYRLFSYGATGTIATFHYIHTYCIENTNSGGGGGTSGASVNYIIKAN